MLASICPVCGQSFQVAAIVAYPTLEREKELVEESGEPYKYKYGLIAVNEAGEGHCSFKECDFATRKDANEYGGHFTKEAIEALADENRYMKEDTYDDYGPPDSDPYDIDGPYY